MNLPLAPHGITPLHHFARYCPNVALAKVVLREHPPSLAALLLEYHPSFLALLSQHPSALAVFDNSSRTPLNLAES